MAFDIALLPAGMTAMAALALGWDALAPASWKQAARPRFLRARPAAARGGDFAAAALGGLQARLKELEGTVSRLRQTGHSLVAQRDAARAEAASLRLALGTAQQELSRVRQHLEHEAKQREAPPVVINMPAPEPGGQAKFRAAKLAFARLYHPDRGGSSEVDRMVRAQVFKEFWAELDRIEKG